MSVAAAATTTVIRKPKATSAMSNPDRRRRVRTAFAFLAPSLIGVVLFLVIPVIFVMVLSLTRWNLLTPIKWVGFSNYANIFRFDGFGHSLLVTAYYVLLNIPVQTVLALGLALLLNSKRKGSALIRVICVLPFLATPVAMGVVWNWFFSPTGIINQLLGSHRHHRAGLAVGPGHRDAGHRVRQHLAVRGLQHAVLPGRPAGDPAEPL